MSEELQDKDLVIAWDNDDIAERTIGFWDAKNRNLFSYDGKRFDYLPRFDNYEKIPKDQEPNWAIVARRRLDD